MALYEFLVGMKQHLIHPTFITLIVLSSRMQIPIATSKQHRVKTSKQSFLLVNSLPNPHICPELQDKIPAFTM